MSSLHTSTRLLENSTRLLENANRSLAAATHDVPRLRKVLNTQKVFGLVPESDLEAAKQNVHTETHPQIKYLVARVEREVARLRRKKVGLESKVDLQNVRLEAAQRNASDGPARTPVDESRLARLKLLQNKRDRLGYTLSRMKLQNARSRLSLIPSLPPS